MSEMGRIKVMQLGSPTALYGAERWIMALVSHLDRHIFDISMTVIRDDPVLDPPLIYAARAQGLDAYCIDAFGRVNFSAIGKLRALIKEQQIDILHTHGYKTDIIGLFAVRGTRCKLVTTPHGWSVDAGIKLAAYEALDRFVFRFFDAVVPLSDTLYSALKKRGSLGAKLHLIANGVDLSEIDTAQRVAAPIMEMRQSGGFIIGYIGQLISRKGLNCLLRAFAAWERPGKQLVLVGEGPQRDALEALSRILGIDDSVQFVGFQSERIAWLRGFDVFVLPSHLEGIPRCLMEAMAAAVPVIASDIPGCRDIVIDGETGQLFAVDDAAGLTRALERSTDVQASKKMAEAGLAYVRAHHSAQAMAAQYATLFQNLTTAKASHA
jgi:glycosyltransferase involved in cell wall biosynthesis